MNMSEKFEFSEDVQLLAVGLVCLVLSGMLGSPLCQSSVVEGLGIVRFTGYYKAPEYVLRLYAGRLNVLSLWSISSTMFGMALTLIIVGAYKIVAPLLTERFSKNSEKTLPKASRR